MDKEQQGRLTPAASPQETRRTIIFADGAAKGNPGRGGWGAIILTPDGEVTELGGAAGRATNNQMELTAAIEALHKVRDVTGEVDVYTDSTYVILGITQWIHVWRRRGWKTAEGTDVLNRPMWEELLRLVKRGKADWIRWHHVRGHSGVPANERVDEIANAFATRGRFELYHGPLANYPVQILPLPTNTARPVPSAKETLFSWAKKEAPYSYLSLVDGKAMRHASWSECERRVKGVSGAKYKKAMSAEEEAEILRSWGVAKI